MVSDVSGLIVTITAMAGGSVSSSFLLVNLHGVRSPMRPKNVILLEKNIIVTNFNDVDLLYYLFLDAMVHHGGRGTVLATDTEPTRAILSHFSQNCVCFCFHVAGGFKAFFGAGSWGGEADSTQDRTEITSTETPCHSDTVNKSPSHES